MARRGRYDSWGPWGYYERRPALAAKGGIKAQNKRGTFGESWWAKRWIAVLESFNIGARLGRGRSYARQGQVLNIEIAKGLVKAKVQGSRPTPYSVTIKVKVLEAADWQKVAQALASQAIFAAKLLAGEMPQEIEETFQAAQLSLFPEKLRDLTTECSCPDWSNPCKHIAAVYYLLGEEFDRDPFLIFKLRGLSREELVGLLGGLSESDAAAQTKKRRTTAKSPRASLPPEPLAAEPTRFWQGNKLPDDFFGAVNLPPVAAALPKRLGNFPFWRGTERFLETIEPSYRQAAPKGLAVYLGDREPAEPAPPPLPNRKTRRK